MISIQTVTLLNLDYGEHLKFVRSLDDHDLQRHKMIGSIDLNIHSAKSLYPVDQNPGYPGHYCLVFPAPVDGVGFYTLNNIYLC